MIRSKIIGIGSYMPTEKIENSYFLDSRFYERDSTFINRSSESIISKFEAITGIRERRYAPTGVCASDMGAMAAFKAIANSGIDRESIDLIVVAHNFGDIKHSGGTRDMVPSLASRIKQKLGIKNPACAAFDIIFGCPGFIQALIQGDHYIRCGEAKNCLIIGTETLSRVTDASDRDSMIFSDGAGAFILQRNIADQSGIINSVVRSDAGEEVDFINSEGSNNGDTSELHYIKMKGRKVYEYALTHVPLAMKNCLDNSGHKIEDLKMVLLHQANQKMDEAIIKRFFELYGIDKLPENIMPMNISLMGNSSVATIPTLFSQVLDGTLGEFPLKRGDLIMMASVGAGMNINAITCRW